MTQHKPIRRERGDRYDRRAELVEAARRLLLEQPFDGVGMAEVASAGSVSRPSVYRYFPGGRAELFVAVAESVVEEIRERLHHAAQGPFSNTRRMEHLLAALFAYFVGNPAAFRLLFQDVWATREPAVAGAVMAVRAQLAAEIADVVASEVVGTEGGDADDVLLTSTGILGCALANIQLVLAGTVDGEAAWRVTCSLAVSALR
jgi:AcrR family transcriptional regulator